MSTALSSAPAMRSAHGDEIEFTQGRHVAPFREPQQFVEKTVNLFPRQVLSCSPELRRVKPDSIGFPSACHKNPSR